MRAPQERRVENKRETEETCASQVVQECSSVGPVTCLSSQQAARSRSLRKSGGWFPGNSWKSSQFTQGRYFSLQTRPSKNYLNSPPAHFARAVNIRSLHYLFWDPRLQVDKVLKPFNSLLFTWAVGRLVGTCL